MLNPEGGKTGKTPWRRPCPWDNGAKRWSWGKASKKKQLQAPERSPDDSPRAGQPQGLMPGPGHGPRAQPRHAMTTTRRGLGLADLRGRVNPARGGS